MKLWCPNCVLAHLTGAIRKDFHVASVYIFVYVCTCTFACTCTYILINEFVRRLKSL